MPHAESVSSDMHRELGHLLEDREVAVGRWTTAASASAGDGGVV
jgi:hypothetical protein